MKFEQINIPVVYTRKITKKETQKSQKYMIAQFKRGNYEYIEDSIRENLIGEIDVSAMFPLDDARTLKLRKEFRKAVNIHGVISNVHYDEKGRFDRICLSQVSLENPQTGELERIDNHMWLMCGKFVHSYCSFYLGSQINLLGSVREYRRKNGQITKGVDKWVVTDCFVPICKRFNGRDHLYSIKDKELERTASCLIYSPQGKIDQNFRETHKEFIDFNPNFSKCAYGVTYTTAYFGMTGGRTPIFENPRSVGTGLNKIKTG